MSILTVAYNSFLFILLLILFFVPINIEVVPYHISLAIIAGIYITGFILSRIYIHNRDKRLAEEHDNRSSGLHYRSKKWQDRYSKYTRKHHLKKISESDGVMTVIRHFFRFSNYNLRMSAVITIMVSLYTYSFLYHFDSDFFLIAPVIIPSVYIATFLIISFFTTVPFKKWYRKQIEYNRDFHVIMEEDYYSGRYISSGESLLVFGDKTLVMANMNGICSIPYNSIGSISRVVFTYPRYAHVARNLENYCGRASITGIIIDVYNAESSLPQFWRRDHQVFNDQYFLKNNHISYMLHNHADKQLISVFLPFNEYQVNMIIEEICQRFNKTYYYPSDLIIENSTEYEMTIVGNPNISDL